MPWAKLLPDADPAEPSALWFDCPAAGDPEDAAELDCPDSDEDGSDGPWIRGLVFGAPPMPLYGTVPPSPLAPQIGGSCLSDRVCMQECAIRIMPAGRYMRLVCLSFPASVCIPHLTLVALLDDSRVWNGDLPPVLGTRLRRTNRL